VTCLLSTASPAAADEAAWVFAADHVTQIDLDLPAASREALAADPREYVQGNFTLSRDDGTTYGPLVVGVKLKGTASFRTLDKKAAFKLKFNEFVKGQTFVGLKKLTLNNMVQDPTMLHELLAYEAFRAVGLPGWRTGYSYVRVDGDDYGVYLNIETPDGVSMPRWLSTTQHLYEGGHAVDLRPGEADQYEVQEGDKKDLGDLEALIAAVDGWDDVEAVADLDELTRFWAVERYIGHVDGYTGTVPNNYFLHSDADGRFRMLPWGTDQTWERALPYTDPGGLMFNRCLDDPPCRARYLAAVDSVSASLGALDLDRLADNTAELLYPWQVKDPRREKTLDEMRRGIAALHAFLAARRPKKAEQPPPTDAPPDPPATPPAGGGESATDKPPPVEPLHKLKLTVSPNRIRQNTPTLVTLSVTAAGQEVAGSRISFDGHKLRTDDRGRAVLTLRLHTPRLLHVRAGAAGFTKGTAYLRVLPRR
jgi:hypothetical protein